MNNVDFVSKIDFTGIPSIAGADVNAGIANGTPLKDTDETVGKSLNLITTDSALNTPSVPDPTTSVDYNKWKRYLWVRRPFTGAAVKASKIYVWNDDTANDPIYLKWLEVTIDLSTIIADVNNALATANNAVAVAEVANDTSNAANNTANTANATAIAATTAANNANTAATNADTNATAAGVAAATAQTTATNAVALNTTPIAIDQRILASPIAYQIPRTNAASNKVEWFSQKAIYAKLTEVYVKGTDNPTAAASGKNTRIFNNADSNIGGIITVGVGTGIITFTLVGVYRIKAWAIINRSGSNPISHQLILANNGDDSTILTGASYSLSNGNTNNVMAVLEGLITVTGIAPAIRLDHYTSTATGVVLGKAANVHPDAGGNEVYASIELEFIGA